jgi:hypothetical protein
MNERDHTDREVGKLTYLFDTGKRGRANRRIWRAVCECGNYTEVLSSDMCRTQSCGCLSHRHANYQPMRVYNNSYSMMIFRHKLRWPNQPAMNYDSYAEMMEQDCTYCGVPPSNKTARGDVTYSGLDRVNNADGYTYANSVSCCAICNGMKGKMDVNAFKDHIRRIHKQLENDAIWENRS